MKRQDCTDSMRRVLREAPDAEKKTRGAGTLTRVKDAIRDLIERIDSLRGQLQLEAEKWSPALRAE